LSALFYIHMVKSAYKAGVHKFSKCVEAVLKLLSPRGWQKNKFCIEDWQVLGSALKNLVATVMWLLEIIHHWYKVQKICIKVTVSKFTTFTSLSVSMWLGTAHIYKMSGCFSCSCIVVCYTQFCTVVTTSVLQTLRPSDGHRPQLLLSIYHSPNQFSQCYFSVSLVSQ